ncbi:GNAT family N-acetyltransferase, partial [Saccharomonospora saliphila]|uniref:GNAT family N-acetyltransferase n=1 Tax=Saccharomonospora saliphila TaxID=369829 RepID=UPI0003604141
HGRRRGVGEALTRAAVDRAAELGAARVVLSSLHAMTSAHRLYTRLGFHRAPDRDWTTSSGVPLLAFAYTL